MIKTVFATIAAGAATIFLSVGAAAAGPGGPQHLNLNMPEQCFPGKGGSTFCVTTKGEETFVQAPSGNVNAEVNVTDSFVVNYNGAVIQSGTDSLHEHVLYTDNFTVVQEGGMHSISTFTSGGMTCTYTADLHVTDLNFATGTANIQYNNFTFACV